MRRPTRFHGFAAAALAACALALPGTARAQSLLATSGLGVPTPPLDARARALGGIPTGLFGFDLSLGNPADAADVRYRGGMASLQPFSRTSDIDGQRATTSGARFPVLRALYPTGRFVASFGYGGFLDQNWAVTTSGMEHFGGDSASVSDVIRSSGGISQMRLGAAVSVTQHIALGAAVGLYTGNAVRQVTRSFPDSVNGNFLGFTTRTQWGFHGPLASVGARADVGTVLRVAASATWSGTLKADSSVGAASPKSYKMPAQAEVGASAILAPKLALSVGGTYAGWAKTTFAPGLGNCGPLANCAPTGELSRNTVSWGAGLEYGGTHTGIRTFPFRLGYHSAQLPFYSQGDVLPSEHSASAGAGIRIGGTEDSPAAQLDAAIERGSRKGGPAGSSLSESFWRLTFSLAVFGR